MSWISINRELPDDGTVVDAKIKDHAGERSEKLKRIGNLWFLPDGSMYVNYKPTHWREQPPGFL